jgi:hypothetical protein
MFDNTQSNQFQGQSRSMSPNVIQQPQAQQGPGLLGTLGALTGMLSGFGVGGAGMGIASQVLGGLGGQGQQQGPQATQTPVQRGEGQQSGGDGQGGSGGGGSSTQPDSPKPQGETKPVTPPGQPEAPSLDLSQGVSSGNQIMEMLKAGAMMHQLQQLMHGDVSMLPMILGQMQSSKSPVTQQAPNAQQQAQQPPMSRAISGGLK